MDWDSWSYTCQLFLRYKREIFILGVLGFLKTTRSFPNIPEEVRSLPKKSEVFRRSPKSSEDVRSLLKTSEVCRRRARSQCFSLQKSEIARKVLQIIYSFYTWFSFLTWVKQDGNNSHFSIRRQKLACRREPAWDRAGMRSKFSTRRRESWQVYDLSPDESQDSP